MTPKLKKIIMLVAAAIILFIVYAVFIKKAPEGDSLVTTDATQTSTDARLLGAKISQALLRIEQIKLDKTIFTDAIYKSLRDRSVAITEEPMGRSNPFAPLGDVSVNSVTRNATSTATSTRSSTSTSTRPVTN